MVNEDILTALKNAIEHGESLQSATAVLINSGYNPREVQEASIYLGNGVINQEPKLYEQLTMPATKSFSYFSHEKPVSKMFQHPQHTQNTQQFQHPQQSQLQTLQKPVSTERDIQQIKREISAPLMQAPTPSSIYSSPSQDYSQPSYYKQEQSLSNQLSQIGPKKSYTKEIILLVILLILIAILIGTILFKSSIISFFSQLVS